MRRVWVAAHERVVTSQQVADWKRKAAAHDGYLAASKQMRAAARRQRDLRRSDERDQKLYSMGWLDCLHAFDTAVVTETARVIDEEPEA